jgi:hypothetical protein
VRRRCLDGAFGEVGVGVGVGSGGRFNGIGGWRNTTEGERRPPTASALNRERDRGGSEDRCGGGERGIVREGFEPGSGDDVEVDMVEGPSLDKRPDAVDGFKSEAEFSWDEVGSEAAISDRSCGIGSWPFVLGSSMLCVLEFSSSWAGMVVVTSSGGAVGVG